MLELADIRQEWKRVRSGIETVIRKTEDDFLPEDIFALCVSKEAALWIDHATGAFFVLQVQRSSFSEERYLLILLAWSPRGVEVESYWPQLAELAKESQCKTVKMTSSRKGWLKRSEWKQLCVCYERTV